MSFSRRLRNVCLLLFGLLFLIIALTFLIAYRYGTISSTQFMVSLYLLFALLAFYAFLYILWGR